MKTTTFFLFLIFSSLQSIGQWEVIHGPTEQGKNYGGMSFVNDSTGFVVQRFDDWPIVRSLILKTIDYGNTWDTVYAIVDTSNQWIPNFSDVFFVNEDEGWVCGTSMPFILHTEDGGATWSEQSISSEEPLEVQDANFEVIEFFDENYGIALSRNSGVHVIETYDGGVHWEVNDALFGFDVSFIDMCNYVINSSGPLIINDDCVINYQTFPSSETGSNPSRHGQSIHVIDEDTWVVTAMGQTGFNNFGSIARTEDGGQSFTFLDLSFANNAVELYFFDEVNGYVSLWTVDSGSIPCSIMKTNDGGLTWYCQETPFLEYAGSSFFAGFSDIECPSPEICYANSSNRIFRTFNGGGPLGEMWTSVSETTAQDVSLPEIYPNPSTYSFQMSNLKPHVRYQLCVLDASGRAVLETFVEADDYINVESLSQGIYIVELRYDSACYRMRFLRQ